ncbi:DNA metabolism protein [Lachnospiraceae bacterium KGMB03038]|nr:DNA metabolism protein [Lachnospiraceae bacterium KGMB03038]
MKTVYICTDTVTGIFSAVYDAWNPARKGQECGIALNGQVEACLFCEYTEVEETAHKAEAVARLIRCHLGSTAYQEISQAVLSYDGRKGDAILQTMLEARKLPDSGRIMEHLSNPWVGQVFEMSRQVGCEAHHLKGFLRFRELDNGILYGEIAPRSQVLSCLAPHFADRLPKENWMIRDLNYQMLAVHEAGKQWVLVWDQEMEEEKLSVLSGEEEKYARLWKDFCQAISIASRENPKCQLHNLPLRFRPYMTEFERR